MKNNLINSKAIKEVERWLGSYSELSFLTLPIEATPEQGGNLIDGYGGVFFPNKKSYELIEFNRTVMSLFALKALHSNNYTQFSMGQKEDVKILPSTFNTLYLWCKQILDTPEKLEAMRVFLVINDLGKIKKYIEMASKEKFQSADHDEILSFLLEHKEEEIPSYYKLALKEKEILIGGAKTSFNMGQFLKAENLPIHLNAIKNKDKKTIDFFLLHTFLDIAGAKGHVNSEGPILASELLCQDFLNGLSALEILANKGCTQAYNYYLSFRAKKLGTAIADNFQTATLRLVHMLNVHTQKEYERITQAVNNLKDSDKEIFINSMSYELSEDKTKTSIFIYYAPAIFSNILSNKTFLTYGDNDNFTKTLKLGINIFIEIFKYCHQFHRDKDCLVMARNVAVLAQKNIITLQKRVNEKDLTFAIFSETNNLTSIVVS